MKLKSTQKNLKIDKSLIQLYPLRSLFFFIFLFFSPLTAENKVVVRSAIDIGSGGPKLRVARVDLSTNRIDRILLVKEYPVIFQECLSQGTDRTLNPEIIHKGLKAIANAIQLAKSYEPEGIAIVGASVFRNAANGQLFAHQIQSEIGLPVHILDQELEAKLAFQAALSKVGGDTENLVVWDIGGGSTQWVGIQADGSYLFDVTDHGSGPFRDFIIESIQCRDVKKYRSPNPLSHEHTLLAETHAAILSKTVNSIFKEKLKNPTTEIVGVGSVFGRGIASLVGKNRFSIEDLSMAVHGLIGKTDAELGGNDFSCIEVSNALLVLGSMKELEIKKMSVIDVNNAEGAMLYKPFWKESLSIPVSKVFSK